MPGSLRIRIISKSGIVVECELDSNVAPRTVEALMKALPFKSRAEFWGQELYFSVPFEVDYENAKDVVNYGDVAYWPEGPALCLFYGPTLSSPSPDVIKPYSPVNVIGKVLGDPKILAQIDEMEELKVEKA
ncbi:MAG: cyclophilin-like fold protein [Candidatus Bathyarchaeota archaeon]|nr:cyclophilin-like fold protein [Candidatus Bathyarchaeota archaeon]MCX8176964.1 cyclophilin-like fold protein [Candidatus Bathyarchaeota archaeon]MDW8193349.1 cyclophilin-like fold protein [Nitrososphaerota archaeon]